MSRNLTPRPVKATGAKDAHGSILDPSAGSLYVHMHRETGLAHRHYVLRPWQVRVLGVVLARPMLLLYVIAVASWGWMASQAARVPLLQARVSQLTHEAQKIDTLNAQLTRLSAQYAQVQQMLGGAKPGDSAVIAPAAR